MMRYFVLLIILFSFNFVFSQSDRKHARDGNKNYFDSLFIKSEVDYRKALAKNPSFEEGKFNLSNSLFKQNRFEESEVVLKDIISHSSDSLLKSEAYYNLGNNFLQQQKLQEAIDSYKNCLRIKPDDEQARYNLSKSLDLLNKQQNQEQDQEHDQEQDQNSGQTDGDDDENDNNDQSDQQDENQSNQSNSKNQSDSQQKKEQSIDQGFKDGELSKEDIERILQALDREEKKVQEKMKKSNFTNKKQLEKDW